MPQLDRDGVAIHYEVRGEGPPVLLSHGFSATSAMFADDARALARTNMVITWDLRGHGASDYPSDPAEYSTSLAIGDMAALLDAAGAQRAVIGGHSLGGYLSLQFAVTWPSRVDALILIGTGPGYRDPDARAGWNRFADGYATTLETEGLAGMPAGEELRVDAHRDASGLILAARHLLTQHDGRVIDALPTISVPTLVIVGANDAPFRASSEYMAAKIPDARLAVIADAGHAPNLSQPDRFGEHVGRFLAEIGHTSPATDA